MMTKTATILVVDGNTSALASLVEPLRKAGYRAVGADSFETARRLLHTEWYDLLITDIRLAAYNGLHLVFHSRVLNPAARAIVLASFPDVSIEIEARRLGAHYVAAPVEPESLLALVGTVLEGAQGEPPRPSETLPARSQS
jgi:DNA-binding response OmpR family regulator